VLGHLLAVEHGADRQADRGGVTQVSPLRRTRASMRANCRSVAVSSSSRLRARSAARSRLRQTINRSPGNMSGALISARSRSSNNDSCNGPFCAASAWIAGARRQLIQSSPAGLRSSRMRAEVIMPRSPTSTTRPIPKRSLIFETWQASVEGSAVFPNLRAGASYHVHPREQYLRSNRASSVRYDTI
jgi:hypothetical protein